jgi:ribosomal-protein-alanine N-acetyltransferase
LLTDPYSSIETQRVSLRCVQEDDARIVATLMTPTVSRWLASWPSRITEEAVIAKITEARTAIANEQALHFLIERRSDRVPMGWIRISRIIDRPRRGDLSYWLNDAYHGQGYASEAAFSAIAAAFDHLDIDAIEAGAQAENVASFAVMRRLGMEFLEERMVWASARGRDELCVFYWIQRERLSR